MPDYGFRRTLMVLHIVSFEDTSSLLGVPLTRSVSQCLGPSYRNMKVAGRQGSGDTAALAQMAYLLYYIIEATQAVQL